MKIENFQIPKSSFLSIDKDTDLIISKMLKNDRLKRLLHWTTKDCITNATGKCPNLTEEESLALVGKEIRLVPRLALDDSVLNYVIITFNNFSPNRTNPEFRDNVIEFHIVCHYDQWHLADGQLRPYRIAAEIDSMFDRKHLSGIGELQFLGANQTVINDNYAGITLFYYAIHGEEDKKNMLSASAEEQFIKEFNETWND
jgi:hypothetical protein